MKSDLDALRRGLQPAVGQGPGTQLELHAEGLLTFARMDRIEAGLDELEQQLQTINQRAARPSSDTQ